MGNPLASAITFAPEVSQPKPIRKYTRRTARSMYLPNFSFFSCFMVTDSFLFSQMAKRLIPTHSMMKMISM
jgi:hypothetical protein